MDVLLAAKPWTFWMALPLVVASSLAVLGVLARYMTRVVAAKYPRQ